MIAAFLAPYALRGVAAPYLWVFYKLLSSIDEPMAFLLSADYLVSPDDASMAGRDELDPVRMRMLGYAAPDKEVLARHHIACLDTELMARLLERHGGNPLAVFKAFLSEEIEELKADLRTRLNGVPSDLEVILTWSNCPSLSAVARERGIRVVHLEMGPLRAHQYRPTAYFDFTGVNGNTEAALRYEAATGFDSEDVSFGEMREAFMRLPVRKGPGGSMVGVVLQVEDDSNLLCFNNGFDNIALIARALLLEREDRLLIRSHPGSRFELRPGRSVSDSSLSTVQFLSACRHVLTINSSIGLEALMWEVPVQVCGDASFLFVAEESDPVLRASKLAFYLSAYLVPFHLIFLPDYIRFRLSDPSEMEIIARHLMAYCGDDLVGSVEVFPSIRDMFANMRQICSEPIHTVFTENPPAAEPDEMERLYFRQANEVYGEDLSLRALSVSAGSERRVRFLLPYGVKPDFVRFDPAHCPASFELTGLGWGWGPVAGTHDLMPLVDFHLRVSAIGGLVDRAHDGIKTFSDSGQSFFELSVGDLWLAVDAGDNGGGILEFSFVKRSLELETVHEQMQIQAVLGRLDVVGNAQSEKLLQLLGAVSNSASQVARIEAALGRLDAIGNVQSEKLQHMLGSINNNSDQVARIEDVFGRLDAVGNAQSENMRQMLGAINSSSNQVARIEDALGRLDVVCNALFEKLLGMLGAINSSNADQVARIEDVRNGLVQLAAEMRQGDAAVEAVGQDVVALIDFLKNKPSLWRRLVGPAS